jgi:hypothetical protein
VTFALAVQEPLQSALHFVSQSAVVETAVHCVVHWSLQQALHEASQSVDDVAVEPSGPDVDEDVVVQDELHPASQRELQSVVQSNLGGLVEQVVEQLDWQLEVQLESADALHCPLHCCSSFAAHASSQLGGAHWVVQSFCDTTLQCALASILMSPQAEMSALAVRGIAMSAEKATAVDP